MTRMLRILIASAAAAVIPAALHATVYVPADLAELATEARAVAHGRVVALEARWLDDRRAIETLVTLDVESYAKGNLGRSVTLRVPGGQMGPYRSVMLGAPRFVEGEEVVVFLGASGPQVPHLVGLAQGVFRVRADARSGTRMVTPEVVRMPGAAPAEAVRVVRGDPARRPMALPAFLEEVRAIASRGAR